MTLNALFTVPTIPATTFPGIPSPLFCTKAEEYARQDAPVMGAFTVLELVNLPFSAAKSFSGCSPSFRSKCPSLA